MMDCDIFEPCTLCLFGGYTPAQRPFVRRRDGTVLCHPAIEPMMDYIAGEIAKQVIREIKAQFQ